MQRDLKLDGLKFIMIFLVVLGHLRFNDWKTGAITMIYAFHMPVFVFLSGLFTSSMTSREKRIKWLRRTFLIYVLAQALHVLLGACLGDTSNLSWRGVVFPGYTLWYLLCLIYWRMAVWYIFAKWGDVFLLVLSCIMAILSGLVPLDGELAFQRAFAFFPFFVLGFVFRRRNLLAKLDNIPITYAWVVLLLGVVVARFLPVYLPKVPYLDLKGAVLRNLQTVLGALLCFSIIRLSRLRFVERFAPYGRFSLWVYIGHSYLIILGNKFFPVWGIWLNLVTAILLAAVYCAFFVGLARVFEIIKNQTYYGDRLYDRRI